MDDDYWDGAIGQLDLLDDFYRPTTASAALTIAGSNDTTIRLKGDNLIVSFFHDMGRNAGQEYVGLYSANPELDITVEQLVDNEPGLLMAVAAENFNDGDAASLIKVSMYGIKIAGNLTLSSGSLASHALTGDSGDTAYGVMSKALSFPDPSANRVIEAVGSTGAFRLGSGTDDPALPDAYRYATNNVFAYPLPSDWKTYAEPNRGTPYAFTAEQKYAMIVDAVAGPFAILENITVTGNVSTLLSEPNILNVTVYGAEPTEVTAADALSWFASLPAGLTAAATTNGQSIEITLSGTPTEIDANLFILKVPIGNSVSPDFDVELNPYATYNIGPAIPVPTYNISYNPGEGVGEIWNVTVSEGSSYTVAENTFTNPGYTFAEWTSASGSYAPGDLITASEDIILTAEWTLAPVPPVVPPEIVFPESNELIYNPNGGTPNTPRHEPAARGGLYIVKENTFERENFTFTEWSTAADGINGKVYLPGETLEFLSSGVTVLHAQWKPNGTNEPGSNGGNTGNAVVTQPDAPVASGNETDDPNSGSKNNNTESGMNGTENKPPIKDPTTQHMSMLVIFFIILLAIGLFTYRRIYEKKEEEEE
ncbi:MAG: InlB B-repeat-containing protein [Methanosarcinales archaeon]|nr:InlB B-repeat-containing protein [Methanosarcinales archaeon]